MSFQHTLDGLLAKGKAKLNEFTHPEQQAPPQNYNQNYNYNYNARPPPPPINYASKPTNFAPPIPPRQAAPYWKADFNPSTPISSIFVQETGAHGWGNNESQNYTTSPTNSFFTPSHQLVLRAISSPSSPENKYTSARLYTHQTLSRPRGCLTAVLFAPCADGIWPAFWLLPQEPFKWPDDGEVDIFESWNGDRVNRSCLHWGHFNGEDWDKHRVVETRIEDMGERPHVFAFAWEQGEEGRGGRCVWYVDGRAVMKATIPQGTRRMSEWRVILNVAMGGNVCGGRLPREGSYDFVVHELKIEEQPVGGWGQFGVDWEKAMEGKTM
ncbi:concanavalin A-like lectin/glucanase [Mollisia scopiformis]|uniref:Concanavalin A-like lectin/glucanase n=1 Tax=Mollisia scopiformis TaxID=149040 RepID=A0A194XG47_MOLSC|nr:concanavalin A-like lectin/glucanase [Mollisia scopiformis]KUJ19148.1 concanavalin A-like lectin/glucanase [Mollisia scopiformis]